MTLFRQFTYKKFGILPFDTSTAEEVNQAAYQPYIKILFLKKGSIITIDFTNYQLSDDALFFINVNQWYKLESQENTCSGSLIYYNRDFYCVEIHDREVSCDGILYNNIYEIPVVYLSQSQSKLVQEILLEIKNEMKADREGELDARQQ